MEGKRDLATFKKQIDGMVAANDAAYGKWKSGGYHCRHREYTIEDVQAIIESGSLAEKILLSNVMFDQDPFYQQIILHYATLPLYYGILIPNNKNGQSINSSATKPYYRALDYVEKMKLKSLLERCALKIIKDGCYYGILGESTKDNFALIDLPYNYCKTRYKDLAGNDLVEFNLSFFNSISDIETRERILKSYPKEIRKEFRKFQKGTRKEPWMLLDPEYGVCFPMFESGIPMFLSMIPACMQYDKAVDNDLEKDAEEIKKIIVQKIPHNATTNELLFEPDEAEVMHQGTVGMLSKNKNVSVLTTYGDVDAIVSKTTEGAGSDHITKMASNVYYKAGVSGQLFGMGSNSSVVLSVKNDMSKLIPMLEKFSNFVTNVINRNFANQNLVFNYTIFPISKYEQEDYVNLTFKLAQSGFSFLTPMVAAGLSQRDAVSIKDLENNILKLQDKLIPLESAYTQSSSGEGVGRPKQKEENKADQTIANEKSIENQGGTD